ncbi:MULTISPECIES: hypothetical protein [unclassified Moraxella]|uniref:hypothetical protein n=1 Tax=unclassified Moraxella TaxID=2685852 RepID=UPI003AF627C5
MSIGQVRTPAVYTEINTNTQRTGLVGQNHKIVLVTDDVQAVDNGVPTAIYDKTTADAKFGIGSVAGRMMATMVQMSQGVNVECLGKQLVM